MRFRIAHVSDFHVAGRRRDRPLVESVFRSLTWHEVDHVVITGDLSNGGQAAAFELVDEVRRRHGYGPDRSTVVPGNHDVPGREAFEKHFGQEAPSVRTLAGGKIALVALDSNTRPDGQPSGVMNSLGSVPALQLDHARDQLSRLDGRVRTTIFALHHHVFPGGVAKEYVGVALKSFGHVADPHLLELAVLRGPSLILTGHSHGSMRQVLYGDGVVTAYIAGKTLSIPRLFHGDLDPRQPNSYQVFDFVDGALVGESRIAVCRQCLETRTMRCPECRGRRRRMGRCPTCKGQGSVPCAPCPWEGRRRRSRVAKEKRALAVS